MLLCHNIGQSSAKSVSVQRGGEGVWAEATITTEQDPKSRSSQRKARVRRCSLEPAVRFYVLIPPPGSPLPCRGPPLPRGATTPFRISPRCARSIPALVALLAPEVNPHTGLQPRNGHHVYITRYNYHYACAHQTQVNWKKKTRKDREERKKSFPIQEHPANSRSRRSLLLSVVGNTYSC